MPNRVLLYVAALLASACTTSLYNGPRRSSSELAYLVSDDSTISVLDGFQTPYSGGNFGRYEILPGEHAVGISLNKVVGGGAYRASTPYTLCLNAEAGKEYRVKIHMVGLQWNAYVVEDFHEGSRESRVNHPCDGNPLGGPKRELPPNEPLDLTPRK